jgi:hypothetical protein
MDYKKRNAEKVLEVVEALKEVGWSRYRMDDVYKELSIFDWWTDYLSQSRLKQMSDFLKAAIKLGYTGYVCFKVGVTGCANGMWAYKEESTNGYSPDGECLYRSFTPAYGGWDVKLADGTWVSDSVETNCTNTPFKVVKNAVLNQ